MQSLHHKNRETANLPIISRVSLDELNVQPVQLVGDLEHNFQAITGYSSFKTFPISQVTLKFLLQAVTEN